MAGRDPNFMAVPILPDSGYDPLAIGMQRMKTEQAQDAQLKNEQDKIASALVVKPQDGWKPDQQYLANQYNGVVSEMQKVYQDVVKNKYRNPMQSQYWNAAQEKLAKYQNESVQSIADKEQADAAYEAFKANPNKYPGFEEAYQNYYNKPFNERTSPPKLEEYYDLEKARNEAMKEIKATTSAWANNTAEGVVTGSKEQVMPAQALAAIDASLTDELYNKEVNKQVTQLEEYDPNAYEAMRQRAEANGVSMVKQHEIDAYQKIMAPKVTAGFNPKSESEANVGLGLEAAELLGNKWAGIAEGNKDFFKEPDPNHTLLYNGEALEYTTVASGDNQKFKEVIVDGVPKRIPVSNAVVLRVPSTGEVIPLTGDEFDAIQKEGIAEIGQRKDIKKLKKDEFIPYMMQSLPAAQQAQLSKYYKSKGVTYEAGSTKGTEKIVGEMKGRTGDEYVAFNNDSKDIIVASISNAVQGNGDKAAALNEGISKIKKDNNGELPYFSAVGGISYDPKDIFKLPGVNGKQVFDPKDIKFENAGSGVKVTVTSKTGKVYTETFQDVNKVSSLIPSLTKADVTTNSATPSTPTQSSSGKKTIPGF